MTRLAVWLLLLGACTLNKHGPWLTEDGVRLENSLVLEYEGSRTCNQQSVTYLVFFGDQYAKDPQGVLGNLQSVDGQGREISYQELDSLPKEAVPTGINHQVRDVNREIWLVDSERDDYLYVAYSDQRIERWARAEMRC